MNFKEAKELARSYLPDYLQAHYGISDLNKNFRCIIDPDAHAHGDIHPSCSYDHKRNRIKCFTTGESMDIFDLVARDEGISKSKAKFRVFDMYGISYEPDRTAPTTPATHKAPEATRRPSQAEPEEKDKLEDFTKLYKQWHEALVSSAEAVDAREYLHNRGLTDETIERFNIGYEPHWKHPKTPNAPGTERIIIPRDKGSYLAREVEYEFFPVSEFAKQSGGTLSGLFNEAALLQSEPCFIVEGEIDAMSIEQSGGHAAALCSTSNYNLLINFMQDHGKDITAPIIISMDHDDVGTDTAEKLDRELKALEETGIYYSVINISGNYKDANDRLAHDPEGLKEDIHAAMDKALAEAIEKARQRLEAYEATSAAGTFEDFEREIEARRTAPVISTGFKSLNETLDGGLYDGLYCIGAISSLGKTTLFMQIADQIAQSGHDVLIFSLEMSKYELMAKSLSRMTWQQASGVNKFSMASTTRDILEGSRYINYPEEKLDAIIAAKKAYKEYAKHIYISEGVGDIGVEQIKEAVEKHISITGRKPVVIIDYLQILAPYDIHATDKQNIDKAVLELKRLSRDQRIPVITISSFNRESYGKNSTGEVKMSHFKESGAIEYSADVLIGLQFSSAGTFDEKGKSTYDEQAEKKKLDRNITAVILKNRNGKAGTRANFTFMTAFNYFREGYYQPQQQEDNEDFL